ncbi:MAG: hypothetical protein HOP28_06500 [Gemmatimonadales bacterium]|nr:hypothetical protein [Gemmatimonadales bacterium]
MNGAIPVFVNDRTLWVAAGSSAGDAALQYDAMLADRLADGTAYITDGRGIRLDATAPAHAGAILRVVVSARRTRDEADAHP